MRTQQTCAGARVWVRRYVCERESVYQGVCVSVCMCSYTYNLMSVLCLTFAVHEQVWIDGSRLRCRRRGEQTAGRVPSAGRHRPDHQETREEHRVGRQGVVEVQERRTRVPVMPSLAVPVVRQVSCLRTVKARGDRMVFGSTTTSLRGSGPQDKWVLGWPGTP